MANPESARRLRNVLMLVASGLTLVSFGFMILHFVFGRDHVFGLLRLFDVGQEANIPTWFSAVLLFACAVALAATGAAVLQRGAPRARGWLTLAVVFLYLSMDEAARIHEMFDRSRGGTEGTLFDLWVFPVGAVVLVIGLLFIPFVRALPRETVIRFVAAIGVYAAGALGLEVAGDAYSRTHGSENLAYAAFAHVEEWLEMMGAILFLHALVLHLHGIGVRLRFSPPVDAGS